MKKIEAIIRPDKYEPVREALELVGYSGLMLTEIQGHGKQKGIMQQWRGDQYKVTLIAKIKLEIVCKDGDVEKIKKAIIEKARTGEVGDGKIFVYDILEATKIRTGESGDSVL
jgi:nitrogen regulatory protein P-II 1